MRIIDFRIDNKYVTLVSSLIQVHTLYQIFLHAWDTDTNEK